MCMLGLFEYLEPFFENSLERYLVLFSFVWLLVFWLLYKTQAKCNGFLKVCWAMLILLEEGEEGSKDLPKFLLSLSINIFYILVYFSLLLFINVSFASEVINTLGFLLVLYWYFNHFPFAFSWRHQNCLQVSRYYSYSYSYINEVV